MTEEKLVADIVRGLYGDDSAVQDEMQKRFAALGPFGEFGWRYLIKRIESTEPHRTMEEWQALQKQLTETLIENHGEFSLWVEKYRDEGLPFGDALEKARERMSPSTKEDKKVLEISLKWLALERITSGVEENRPLEVIAGDFHVSEKCVREVYYDFVEIMVSDYMGDDYYRNLGTDRREHLKRLFIDILSRDLSIQEFSLQIMALKREIIGKIHGYSLADLSDLPKEQAKYAMRLFLESGGEIGEQDLVAWAGDKDIKPEELDALLTARSHTE